MYFILEGDPLDPFFPTPSDDEDHLYDGNLFSTSRPFLRSNIYYYLRGNKKIYIIYFINCTAFNSRIDQQYATIIYIYGLAEKKSNAKKRQERFQAFLNRSQSRYCTKSIVCTYISVQYYFYISKNMVYHTHVHVSGLFRI